MPEHGPRNPGAVPLSLPDLRNTPSQPIALGRLLGAARRNPRRMSEAFVHRPSISSSVPDNPSGVWLSGAGPRVNRVSRAWRVEVRYQRTAIAIEAFRNIQASDDDRPPMAARNLGVLAEREGSAMAQGPLVR